MMQVLIHPLLPILLDLNLFFHITPFWSCIHELRACRLRYHFEYTCSALSGLTLTLPVQMHQNFDVFL